MSGLLCAFDLRRWATDRTIGILCAVIAVTLFASFTVVSRMGFTSTALALPDLAMLRFGIAGLVLLPILLRRGLGALRWSQAVCLALTGGLGFALFAYTGFRLAPASHGGVLLHGTIPLFTFVLTWWITGRHLPIKGWRGSMLILIGITAIASDVGYRASAHQWLGNAALLLAALSWSVYGLISQRLTLEPLHAVAIVATGSLACFLPLYLMLPANDIKAVPWSDIAFQGVFQGILIGIVSGVLYTRAVASLGAQHAALFTAAVPCLTTFAGLWLLGEKPSWWVWIGVGLVTSGMLVGLISRGGLPAVAKEIR